jgi:hypothetical protein
LNTEHRAAWEGFRREFPWLAESDRALLEIAAVLRARPGQGDEVGVQALNLLRLIVAQMGGTPADRAKVTLTEDDESDPVADYFV